MTFTNKQAVQSLCNLRNVSINLFVLLLLSFLLFSCRKDKPEVAKPKDELNLPRFDATNSTALTWDQLPAELKNATEIKGTDDNKNARVSGALYYSNKIGPWGGWGGSSFSVLPPSATRIYAMAISAANVIDRIVIWYVAPNGTIYVGADRGGNGGTYNVQYFSPDEYISGIEGRSGGLLDQLTIYTNRKVFAYGGSGGTPFYAQIPVGYQVLGFWGRSGWYIDQIGFYVYTR